MLDNKIKPNMKNVEDFLRSIDFPQKRADSFELLKIIKEITVEKPIMWGDSIVGFGSYIININREKRGIGSSSVFLSVNRPLAYI